MREIFLAKLIGNERTNSTHSSLTCHF